MNRKISKIEIQKKNKNRVNIYIDNEYEFSCSTQIVYSHSLKKGEFIDEAKKEKIIEEDSFINCKNYALNVIERNSKTEKEMEDKLKKKGYNDITINKVVEFLKEYKLVDDRNFAELFIRDKIKKNGKTKIKYDLSRKGISKEIIAEKLLNINLEEEETAAFVVAEKRYKLIIKTEQNYLKVYARLKNYMLRAGYSLDTIDVILNKLIKRSDFENEEYSEKIADKTKLKTLAEKRYNVIARLESEERKIYKKLWEYLMRRGYKQEDIKAVLKEVLVRFE